MVSEAIGLATTTVGLMVLSFFAPEIVNNATDTESSEWMDFVYKMATGFVAPILVALIWSRRRKRKDGRESNTD